MGPVAACKGIRISESGKILLVESGILDFVIRKTAQGIRDPTDDWNPESKFHWQRLESGKLSTEVHVPTPRSAVWPVPYACAQPYPPPPAVVAMNSCFVPIGARQHGIAVM